MRRREFLRGVGAVAAMGFAARTLGAGDRPAFPRIVDTHQHLWNLDKFRLPWLDHAGPVLKRNYSMDDYVKAADGLSVAAAVYMEVAVAPEQQAAEADEVIGVCEGKIGPTVAAVIGGRPESDGFRDYIVRFRGNRFIKGVRSSFPIDGKTNAQFHQGLKLLGELGMSYDLLLDSSLLPQAVKVVEACPETRFILDHCGNASTKFYSAGGTKDPALQDRRRVWEEGIAALAEKKNAICKISGVAESGTSEEATMENIAPIVNHCLDRFGGARVVFASNWPVCLKAVTFARWVELARKITEPRGESFQDKLFHGNAEQFYGLK